MRVRIIVIACALVLAACSGGAAASATPSIGVTTPAPSIAAASVAPPASAAPTNCMNARAYDLLTNPSTDWKAVTSQDREFAAAALEAYDFPVLKNPAYIKDLAKALRDPGVDLNQAGWLLSIWAGEVAIVSCG